MQKSFSICLLEKAFLHFLQNRSLEFRNQKINGENIEDLSDIEGNIYYDIKFTAYIPNKNRAIKLIINVESQITTKWVK